MKRIILYISTIQILISCSNCDDRQKSLENIYGSDTLQISAQFGDCGEWGGHIESMDIYRTDNDNLTLHFQKDTVTCPVPSKFNRRIIDDWTKELTSDDQKHIATFICNLTNKSFEDEGISNGGDHYYIKRSRGHLSVRYSNYGQDWTGFKELKKKITTANNR